MIILGIHDSHNASASLIIDGKASMLQLQKRDLSRLKNHYGFPAKAIHKVCIWKSSGIKIKDVDRIAMSSKHLPPSYLLYF
jgi:predicted NodU family carbamoyl transferase